MIILEEEFKKIHPRAEYLVGKRFNKLTVINYGGKQGKREIIWICRCDCNNLTRVMRNNLKSGHTTSCGCNGDANRHRARKDLSGQNFRLLMVIKRLPPKIYHNNTRLVSQQYLCECQCGRQTKVLYQNLIEGRTKSCGSCKKYRRGIPVSNKQLDIYKMFGRGVLNFPTKTGRYIDIAFVHNSQKIAIEYDGVYWHDEERDNKRNKELVCSGWKILHIVSQRLIPKKEQLLSELNLLISSNDVERTLHLEDAFTKGCTKKRKGITNGNK